MTRKKKGPKTRGPYWRQQLAGSQPRAYADFRFLGGKREPLCAPGETVATTDPVLAMQLYASRLAALSDGSVPSSNVAAKREGAIVTAVQQYLDHRRTHSKATPAWRAQTEIFLGRAVTYFGRDRQLRTVKPDDVAGWIVALRTDDSGRGGTFAEETIRKHIHTLSGLFRRAQRVGWVPPGYNPVALLEADERPGREPSPDVWLEVPDAARLLEAARTYPVTVAVKKNVGAVVDANMLTAYPLIATFLLTGGRADEVLGLDINDILFDRRLVAFRPNQWRRGKKGKTAGATRMVPLWPQLAEILDAYLKGRRLELALQFGLESTLLFPSAESGRRIVDIRKTIDRVAKRAGLREGIYRATAFRKTFASAALQITDGGAPIAQRTVQGWMGHSSSAMLEAIYGKLGTVRHRRDVLEYRVADSAENSAKPTTEGVIVPDANELHTAR